MPATKSNVTLLNAVTTTQTSAAQDVSGDYADDIYVKIVQVGPPTTPASFVLSVSEDGGVTFYDYPAISTGASGGTFTWPAIAVAPSTTHLKVTFTAQVGGTSSTCTVQLGRVTAI